VLQRHVIRCFSKFRASFSFEQQASGHLRVVSPRDCFSSSFHSCSVTCDEALGGVYLEKLHPQPLHLSKHKLSSYLFTPEFSTTHNGSRQSRSYLILQSSIKIPLSRSPSSFRLAQFLHSPELQFEHNSCTPSSIRSIHLSNSQTLLLSTPEFPTTHNGSRQSRSYFYKAR
jgi:hypothetical protein